MLERLMKRRTLIVLGVVAFIVFALATLPARVVLARLASSGVQASGVAGTIWNGQAQVLTVGGGRIGSVSWRLRVLPLFTGRASAQVNVKREDGFLESGVSASPSGRVAFSNLTGSLPLSALPPNVLRGGWTGALNLKLANLVLESGWPTAAAGVVEVIDITGPANKPVNMGSYKATFAEDDAPEQGVLRGAVVDLGGPIEINGTIELKAAERSYRVQGLVATRPDAPRDVTNALQFLGPPDQRGRREFGTEGTF
jgi:general secretion pathway protein N